MERPHRAGPRKAEAGRPRGDVAESCELAASESPKARGNRVTPTPSPRDALADQHPARDRNASFRSQVFVSKKSVDVNVGRIRESRTNALCVTLLTVRRNAQRHSQTEGRVHMNAEGCKALLPQNQVQPRYLFV